MTDIGWMVAKRLDDNNDGQIYITSSYLATVTFSGVGYGDLVSFNRDNYLDSHKSR